MDAISTLSAITGAASSVAGMLNNDSEKQQNYTMELMKVQNEYNKEATERSLAAQKEMYEYTGYASKVRQLKEAGLNPGLIYGMGASGGGVTGNTAAPSVSGGAAPNVPASTANKLAATGMGLQLSKLQSEIELNKSIAEANRAKAGLESQQTTSETLKQSGITLDNKLKEITLNVENKTVEDKITAIKAASDKAVYDATKAIGEMTSSLAKGTVDKSTTDEQIKLVNISIAQAYTEIAALKSNMNLNDAKRKEIANAIEQAWTRVEYDGSKMKAEISKIWKEYFNADTQKSDEIMMEMLGKLFPNVSTGVFMRR